MRMNSCMGLFGSSCVEYRWYACIHAGNKRSTMHKSIKEMHTNIWCHEEILIHEGILKQENGKKKSGPEMYVYSKSESSSEAVRLNAYPPFLIFVLSTS